jgi:hypothetical protein
MQSIIHDYIYVYTHMYANNHTYIHTHTHTYSGDWMVEDIKAVDEATGMVYFVGEY